MAAFTRIIQAGQKLNELNQFRTRLKPAARFIANENKPGLIQRAFRSDQNAGTLEKISARRINDRSFQKISRAAAQNDIPTVLAEFAQGIDESADILSRHARDLSLALAGLSLDKRSSGGTQSGTGSPQKKADPTNSWSWGDLLGAGGIGGAGGARAGGAGRLAGIARLLYRILGPVGIGLLMKGQIDENQERNQALEDTRRKDDEKKYGKKKAEELAKLRDDISGPFAIIKLIKRLWGGEKSDDSTIGKQSSKLEFNVQNKIKFEAREIRFNDKVREETQSGGFRIAPGGLAIGEKATAGPAAGIDPEKRKNQIIPRRGRRLPGQPSGSGAGQPSSPSSPNEQAPQAPSDGHTRVHERQGQVAAIRRLPIQEQLKDQLEYAATQTGVQVEITSGGQAGIGTGGPRTGSTRHDHGGAADLKLFVMKNGKKHYLDMRNEEDRAVMEKFTRETVRAGATGVGAGVGYMGPNMLHIGGGRPASWGGADWIERARKEGVENRKGFDLKQWKEQHKEKSKIEESPKQPGEMPAGYERFLGKKPPVPVPTSEAKKQQYAMEWKHFRPSENIEVAHPPIEKKQNTFEERLYEPSRIENHDDLFEHYRRKSFEVPDSPNRMKGFGLDPKDIENSTKNIDHILNNMRKNMPSLEPPAKAPQTVPHLMFAEHRIREQQGTEEKESDWMGEIYESPSFSDYIGAA